MQGHDIIVEIERQLDQRYQEAGITGAATAIMSPAARNSVVIWANQVRRTRDKTANVIANLRSIDTRYGSVTLYANPWQYDDRITLTW